MRKFILIVVLMLGGCKDVPMLPTLTPYKMDIQQGNVVTQDMVAKLRPGMTRSQVRFILGTPLIVDPFRNDRWDYVYLFKKGGGLAEQRRFAVIFKEDKLTHLEGDVMPEGPPKPGAAEVKTPETAAPAKPSAAPDGLPAAGGAQGSVPSTGSGEPPNAEQPKPAETQRADSGSEKPDAEQAREERGFFGRLLETLGF